MKKFIVLTGLFLAVTTVTALAQDDKPLKEKVDKAERKAERGARKAGNDIDRTARKAKKDVKRGVGDAAESVEDGARKVKRDVRKENDN